MENKKPSKEEINQIIEKAKSLAEKHTEEELLAMLGEMVSPKKGKKKK